MLKVYNKRNKNIPPDAVYVGRPSKWGNPYPIQGTLTREDVVQMFRVYAEAVLEKEPDWLKPLTGKDLVCWCAPKPCHADVLLELANQAIGGEV